MQKVTIRIGDTTYTTVYVSPEAKREQTEEALDRINKLAGGKGLIMSDLNARNTRWDKRGNVRGTALKRRARTNKWQICALEVPTYVAQKGSSHADLFLTKDLECSKPTTGGPDRNRSSDHLPVYLTVTKTAPENAENSPVHIPRKQ